MNIGAFAESVVDNGFVLVHSHGTRRVDEITACFGYRIDAVDCTKNELFLEVGKKCEIALGLSRSASICQKR